MLDKKRTVFVPPTGPDLLNVVSQNALANARAGTPAMLQLPSLRDRARLVVSQANFLALVDWF